MAGCQNSLWRELRALQDVDLTDVIPVRRRVAEALLDGAGVPVAD